MAFKIGDVVRKCCGRALMRIIEFADSCRVAVCRVLDTGAIVRVLVVLLVAAGGAIGTAHGHPVEENPSHTSIEPNHATAPIIASGTIASPPALVDEAAWTPQTQSIPWRASSRIKHDDEVLPLLPIASGTVSPAAWGE